MAAARDSGFGKETVPEEVAAAYGEKHKFGDYIIPAPFDPRLMEVVSLRWLRLRWTRSCSCTNWRYERL